MIETEAMLNFLQLLRDTRYTEGARYGYKVNF